MTIKQLKKELRLTNYKLAEFFEMSTDAYQNSSARKRRERALVRFYKHVKNRNND